MDLHSCNIKTQVSDLLPSLILSELLATLNLCIQTKNKLIGPFHRVVQGPFPNKMQGLALPHNIQQTCVQHLMAQDQCQATHRIREDQGLTCQGSLIQTHTCTSLPHLYHQGLTLTSTVTRVTCNRAYHSSKQLVPLSNNTKWEAQLLNLITNSQDLLDSSHTLTLPLRLRVAQTVVAQERPAVGWVT